MPAFSRAALLSLLLLLASCSGGADTTTQTGPAEPDTTTGFDDFQTPPPSASADRTANSDQPAGQELAANDQAAPPADSNAAPEKSDAADMQEPAAGPDLESAEPADEAEQPIPPRETLAGRWEFLLCQFGADILGMLIEIEKEGEAYTARLVDDSPMMPEWKITSAEITDKQASISFMSHDDTPVSFEGALQEDGVVRGNVKFGEEGTELVRLLATRRESLDDADPQVPSDGVEKMQGFQPDPDNALAQLREKLTDLGDSALAFELARRLSAVYRGQRPPEEEYQGFPEQYLAAAEPWGKRVTDKAHLDIAYTMALCGYSTEEADRHLAVVETDLADNSSESDRQRVTTARGLIDLQSDDAQRQQQALEALHQLRNANPFETNVTLGLAAFHERNQQPEEALAMYAELEALPTGAGDMEPVERIWKELGREPEQLENYLDKIYKERAHLFAAAQSDAPRAEGRQHTILGELFTGAMCPPCVAADVATGGLEITFPATDFIMLRYHQHVPGPDPLTVADGEERAAGYYRIEGTPSLFFNGQPIQVMSMYGPITNAAEGYTDLREVVEQLLTQSSDLNITLEASASDGTVNISAAVEGAEEFPDSWRLRLVLAEEEIFFKARNGVRLHEMVVRAMPGGAEGIGAEEGQLKYTGTVSLDELREQITSFVSQQPGLPAPPTDFSHLHVIAFVQDDTNRRILQATTVPVADLAGNAGAPAPATPDETQPAEELKPDVEKPDAAADKLESETPGSEEAETDKPEDSPAELPAGKDTADSPAALPEDPASDE
jgi:hypothetical protein